MAASKRPDAKGSTNDSTKVVASAKTPPNASQCLRSLAFLFILSFLSLCSVVIRGADSLSFVLAASGRSAVRSVLQLFSRLAGSSLLSV